MGADVLHLHRHIHPGSHPGRGRAAILTDLDVLHERQRKLYDELAQVRDDEPSAPQRAPVDPGPEVCLKEAARRTGWSPRRIKRQVLKHNEQHPGDRIGWQPFGAKGAEWRILLGRLQERKADR